MIVQATFGFHVTFLFHFGFISKPPISCFFLPDLYLGDLGTHGGHPTDLVLERKAKKCSPESLKSNLKEWASLKTRWCQGERRGANAGGGLGSPIRPPSPRRGRGAVPGGAGCKDPELEDSQINPEKSIS